MPPRSVDSLYKTATFNFLSTKASNQPDGSPCRNTQKEVQSTKWIGRKNKEGTHSHFVIPNKSNTFVAAVLPRCRISPRALTIFDHISRLPNMHQMQCSEGPFRKGCVRLRFDGPRTMHCVCNLLPLAPFDKYAQSLTLCSISNRLSRIADQ